MTLANHQRAFKHMIASLSTSVLLFSLSHAADIPDHQVDNTIPAVAHPSMQAVPHKAGTADHTKFDALKQPFASGPEVTQACLACHTEAGDEVMHSLHWQWQFDNSATGQILGKRHVINSFCGNVAANEPRCTSCHVGYGWDDMRQPPPVDKAAVDCLACHDNTGTYAKLDNQAGHPAVAPFAEGSKTITGKKAQPIDLSYIAQSVGKSTRENCGNCHFYGGGGDNVKHGDLSSALVNPAYTTDIHMSPDGEDFSCATCHVTNQHLVAGSRYHTLPSEHPHLKPGQARETATCQSCHGEQPHDTNLIGLKLNDHTQKVACQTCHIPSFARGGVATKTFWDWSTAGKLKDGKPYHEEGFTQSDGKKLHTYLSTKGDFKWGENVTPYYAWFNGKVEYTKADKTINPNNVVTINQLHGRANETDARIWPFKRMVGKQAYDTQYNKLVYNHVYGPDTDTALWTNFNWDKSIAAAMAYMNEPYSGQYDFVDTQMFWPITHMVAPKEDALACDACHIKNGRLEALKTSVYMPAAQVSTASLVGVLLLGATLFSILGHVVLRLLGKSTRR